MKVLLVTMAVVGLAAVVIAAPEFGRRHHQDEHRHHRGINGEPCRPAGSNRTVGAEECVCVQRTHEGFSVSRWHCQPNNATTTTAASTTTLRTTVSTTTAPTTLPSG